MVSAARHTLVDAEIGADREGEGEGEYGANVNDPAMRHVGSASKLTRMGFSAKEGWQPSPAPVIIAAASGGSSPRSGHEQKSRFSIKRGVLGRVRFFVRSFVCLCLCSLSIFALLCVSIHVCFSCKQIFRSASPSPCLLFITATCNPIHLNVLRIFQFVRFVL